jgi:selenocysteine lyase/cysteine desulfurase
MILPVTYFDNAATTYPKPEQVYLALDREFRQSGNAGRGTHPLALNGARQIFESRECIADFLGVSKSERLIFTPGCTQSLNVVLNSLSAYGTRAGAETLILISGLEHNAIMRPLNKLQQTSGLKIQSLSYSVGRFCDLTELEEALQTLKPAMFILTEGSNVTGEVADLSAVATLCKTYRVPLLVDAAQTAGRRQSCLNHDGITFWCASAHKNLMGPQGLGLLYVHADFSLDPLVLGGTGSASEQLSMPEAYPDHLESGTMPAFLIAGLKAGVTWLREVGTEVIIAQASTGSRCYQNLQKVAVIDCPLSLLQCLINQPNRLRIFWIARRTLPSALDYIARCRLTAHSVRKSRDWCVPVSVFSIRLKRLTGFASS